MEANSLLNNQQTIDNMADDVLVEIFSYFTGEELLSLQTVCSKWDQIICTMINWKRILDRKLNSCPNWNEVWKSYTISFKSKALPNYKTQFKDIHLKIQEMDRNWRSGNFTEVDIDISGEHYEGAGDDYLIHSRAKSIVIYDRRKLHVAHKVSGYDKFGIRIKDNLIFLPKSDQYDVLDARNGTKFQITKPVESEFLSHVATNSKMMAIVYRGPGSTRFDSVLQLWQKENERYELVSEEIFYDKEIRVDMDDCYMALYEGLSGQRFRPGLNWHFTVHFSRDSVVERSLAMRIKETSFLYSRGYFYLIHKSGEIRIMEVRSGKWIRTIEHPDWNCFYNACQYLWWTPVAVNSKYLATVDGTAEYPERSVSCTVQIYDLVAAKDPSSSSSNFLLATIYKPGFRFYHFKMNEREIFGYGETRHFGDHFYFKSFNFLGTASGGEVISNITHRRAVRKPTRYGQGKVVKGRLF